jgi:hypothetical protein
MKRFLGLILALAVTVGFAPASQARSGRAHDERLAFGVELTYTKWFPPGFPNTLPPAFPNMVGVVGGDIVGKFGGAVIQATPTDATGRFVRLTAVYIVVAADPAKSFTAHVEGVQDNQTHTAVLDGSVVDGYLKRAHVHAQYTVISCAQAPNGTCFQGTISVTRWLGSRG